MSASRLLYIFLAALVPAIVVAALLLIIPGSLLPLADSGAALLDGQKGSLVNFSHNGFILWHFPVAKLLGLSCFPAIIGLHLILLAAGILLALAILLEVPLLTASLMGTISAVALLSLFGLDSVISSVLSYLPWLLLSAILSWQRPLFLIATASIAWMSALHLGSFAIFNLIIIMPVALALHTESYDWRNHLHLRSPTLLLVCALVLPILPYLAEQLPSWPDYPHYAHLVPDDGVAGLSQALVGPSLPLAHIDRFYLKAVFPTMLGWFIFFFAVCVPSQSQSTLMRYLRAVCFSLGGLALADTLVPEHLTEVMPLAALSRLIPGWISWPLTPLAFGAALTLLPIAFARAPIRFALCNLAVIFTSSISLGRPLALGVAFSPTDSSAWRELSSNLQDRNILLSPSYNLLREQGGWLLTEYAKQPLKASRLLNTPHQLAASQNQELLALADDGLSRTRWFSTGQLGTEWVSIRFESPQTLAGVRLQISEFKSDFPRGIAVSYQPTCAMPAIRTEQSVPIVEHSSWQGEVLYSEAGFPYFGGQDRVEIRFPKEIAAQCLLLKQTSKARRFDWSIGEIALLQR